MFWEIPGDLWRGHGFNVSQAKSEHFTFPLVRYSTEVILTPDNVIQLAVNRRGIAQKM